MFFVPSKLFPKLAFQSLKNGYEVLSIVVF